MFWLMASLGVAVWLGAEPAGSAEVRVAMDRSGFRPHWPIMAFGCLAIGMEARLIGLGPTALIQAGIAEDRASALLSLFFVLFLSGRLTLVFLADRVASFTLLTGAVAGAALCSFGAALGDPQVFFPPIGLAAGLFFPGYYVTGNRKMGTDVRVAPILIGVGLTGAIVSPLIVAQLIGNLGDRGFFWLIADLRARWHLPP